MKKKVSDLLGISKWELKRYEFFINPFQKAHEKYLNFRERQHREDLLDGFKTDKILARKENREE